MWLRRLIEIGHAELVDNRVVTIRLDSIFENRKATNRASKIRTEKRRVDARTVKTMQRTMTKRKLY
jgi:hypothetical protein